MLAWFPSKVAAWLGAEPYRRLGGNHIILRRIAPCTLLVLLLTLGSTVPAEARSHERRAREGVLQRQARLAAELDVMRSEDEKVEAALNAMNADVAAQQALLSAARLAAQRAEAQLAAARAAEARIGAEIKTLEANITNMAVRAFVGQGVSDGPSGFLESSDPNEIARRSALTRVVFGNAQDDRDRLDAAREDLAAARQEAEAASKAASRRRAEEDQRLGQVSEARDRQAGFAAQLDTRIEARLAEAAALERLDRELSAEIQRRQQALARNNRGSRGGAVAAVAPGGSVSLRNVRGIWVHESMAGSLEDLLAAAEADGIRYGGGGYRDPEDQRRLRQANCPDPETSPASSCSPPTARPGQSMHERGLAVDFTYGGRIISSRSSPGYKWLDQNASRFGLYNLPSEPWHWSTNGN